jgi:protein required for attachment to host cells
LERVHDGRFYNPAAQVNAGSELIGAGTLHPATAHAFARLIADYLYRAACAGQFSRLVLAAPDAILLSLQQEFPRRVVRQVASIVAQDLTHLDPGALARSLAAVLPQ